MKKVVLLLAMVGMVAVACTPGGGLDDDNNGNQTEQPGGGNGGNSGNDDAIPTDKIVIKPATIEVAAEASDYVVAVSSPCSWRATTENDWITIETKLGIDGKRELIFSVVDYWETEPREGKIVVANSDEGLSAELTITQKAFVPELEISTTSYEYDYKGGEFTVAITSNFAYDVTTTADWVKYTKDAEGVKVAVSLNKDTEARSTEVRIYSNKYGLAGNTITITQTPSPYPIGALVTKNGVTGVVFYFDETATKIVSVEQDSFLSWSYECVTTGATDGDNGANNMAIIKSISGWEDKYPAFKWCSEYGEGWYLPALNELREIYNNLNAINATLKANGYTTLYGSWYWSSTEGSYDSAYMLGFSKGIRIDGNKIHTYDVCAVLAFEN